MKIKTPIKNLTLRLKNNKKLLVILIATILFLLVIMGVLFSKGSILGKVNCQKVYSKAQNKFVSDISVSNYRTVNTTLKNHEKECLYDANNLANSVDYADLYIKTYFLIGDEDQFKRVATDYLKWFRGKSIENFNSSDFINQLINIDNASQSTVSTSYSQAKQALDEKTGNTGDD